MNARVCPQCEGDGFDHLMPNTTRRAISVGILGDPLPCPTCGGGGVLVGPWEAT
jgi:DnaJ-class molecular chaperone